LTDAAKVARNDNDCGSDLMMRLSWALSHRIWSSNHIWQRSHHESVISIDSIV